MHQVNDGRCPDNSPVEIRNPRTKQQEQGDGSAWPWLPGSILERCGPDEWYVCVEVQELAVRDGRRARRRLAYASGVRTASDTAAAARVRPEVPGGEPVAARRQPGQ